MFSFSASQSSTQEIGEEAEEDAIFTITLRKVQLHQSASKGQRWLGVETDSALSLYETCKVRTIKAGTLERLVEYMVTAFKGKDSTYVTIFLCTYRSFTTTKQVLDLLLNRSAHSTHGEKLTILFFQTFLILLLHPTITQMSCYLTAVKYNKHSETEALIKYKFEVFF